LPTLTDNEFMSFHSIKAAFYGSISKIMVHPTSVMSPDGTAPSGLSHPRRATSRPPMSFDNSQLPILRRKRPIAVWATSETPKDVSI
jgi:hypothetical protein